MPVLDRSFDDIIANGYTVFTPQATASSEMLKNAKPGSAMQTYYQSSMEGNPDAYTATIEDSLKRLMAGDGTSFYFGSNLSPLGWTELVALETTDSTQSQIGWTFQKDSELTAFFNYHLFNIYESGLWAKTFHDWTYSPSEEFWSADAPSLGYDNTSFPFVTLAWLIFAALITLAIERLWLFYKLRKKARLGSKQFLE